METAGKDSSALNQPEETSSTFSTHEDDSSSSCREDSIRRSGKRKSRASGVSFQEQVLVHEFPIILGDNPACSVGPPIMLLWPIDHKAKSLIESRTELMSRMEMLAIQRYETAKEAPEAQRWETMVAMAATQGPPVRALSAVDRSSLLQHQPAPLTCAPEEILQVVEMVKRIQRQRLTSFRQSHSLLHHLRHALSALFSTQRVASPHKVAGEMSSMLAISSRITSRDPEERVQQAMDIWKQAYAAAAIGKKS
jgi:hypothetical protein